jgi:uncharacterized membrane protein YoaK (UPF0700 family)
MPQVAIHPPQRVYAPENLAAWFALAAAAGMVNVAGFLATERFVSHITGTVAQTGFEGEISVLLEALALICAFIAGATASVLWLQARRASGREPLFHAALLCVAALLLLVALLGAGGVFGAFGATLEGGSTGLLMTLAFTMGLQNASVASATDQLVRTTHLTGPATDLGVNLGTAAVVQGEQRRKALVAAGLRFGKLVSFGVGAAVMLPLSSALGWWAFAVPAALVGACAAMARR